MSKCTNNNSATNFVHAYRPTGWILLCHAKQPRFVKLEENSGPEWIATRS